MKLLFKNKELDLAFPSIMGILNVSPDSFFDGGKYNTEASLLKHAEKMIAEGATILDLGACSTRPNADIISEEEELNRLMPALRALRKKFPGTIISVDTYRSLVVEMAVQEGADMINDISGGALDQKMFDTIGKLNVPYVLMHMQGNPKTMQKKPLYSNVINEVMDYFKKNIYLLHKKGAGQIIIDPGFGFGKNIEHNYTLLKHLQSFKELELPILVGLSRKSMISNLLELQPSTSLNGTTVANTIALMNGANILRVHDVKEAVEATKIVNALHHNN